MGSSPGVSAYRLGRAYAVRPLGIAAGLTGLAVLAAAAARGVDAPAWVHGAILLVAVLLAAVTALAALAALRPPVLLRLDEDGYRVRRLTGTAAGSWRDVNDVTGGTRSAQSVLAVRNAEGRVTLLPAGMLDAPAAEVEADVRRRLNTAVGYRRVTPGSIRRGRAPKPS